MGDAATFERLVSEHRAAVYRICRAILGDDHLGADAAQEVFLRLWRHLRRAPLPDSPPAWLRRTGVSCALDLARWRQRRRQEPAGEGDDAPPAGPRADPVAQASAHETERRLAAALATLPEGQRTVFLLRHAGGLTLREVADTLDLALPTVKTHFARACLKLQPRLAAWSEHGADR